MDNELLLIDRIGVIRDTVKKYGEGNFYISYSGGKDSTVVSELVDLALPGNTIPRVFINTGIEYNAVVQYVKDKAKKDKRFIVYNSGVNIRKMLEEDGYPFKSKEHAKKVFEHWKRGGRMTPYIHNYIYGVDRPTKFSCPELLRYQFLEEPRLPISHQCCNKLKKEPVKKWCKASGRYACITGMRSDEGGARGQIGCVITDKSSGKLKKFNPLIKVNEQWVDWYVQGHNIRLCRLYYEPYNFKRTGCKGCPFALELQEQLEIMSKYLPEERKQCEILWKPVYNEYRRLGYRLKKDEQQILF